ncbi:sugar O-acetyltransferase [Corynebacterium urogenitale]
MSPEQLRERIEAELHEDPDSMLNRMNAGLLYHADNPTIQRASLFAKSLAQHISRLDITDEETRHQKLEELLGTYDGSVTIMPSITVDYGHNIHIGSGTFINFDSIFLDICPITIGANCQIGPRAQFLAALHPMDNHQLRAAGWEYGSPITIGDNVWFGGGVTVCAGVTIGENSVIGAGSVVTRDIPPHTFAAGTPAKPIREL